MKKPVISTSLILLGATVFYPNMLEAQIPVRQTEGLVHGFLVLSTLDGEILADGEQTQVDRGDQITIHFVFRFKDGSVHEETTVFSQRRTFRLISGHLVQKGPSFKQPMDFSVIATSGEVTVRYTDSDGKEKILSDHLHPPDDVANGMILTLLKNLPSKIPHTNCGGYPEAASCKT